MTTLLGGLIFVPEIMYCFKLKSCTASKRKHCTLFNIILSFNCNGQKGVILNTIAI